MGRIQEHIAATCDLTLIRCMDWRMDNGPCLRHALVNAYGPGRTFDTVSLAGSCYALVHGEATVREFFLEQVSTSVSLHQSEIVAIVQHTDCGQYKKVMTFENGAHEFHVLSDDILSAAKILREHFPNVDVHGYIALLQDDRVVQVRRTDIPNPVVAMPNVRERAHA